MSEDAAADWLNNHPGIIPGYDDYHLKVSGMLEEAVASMTEIADIIMLDPGLSIALLQTVNERLESRGRPFIETVQIAMGHLGKPTISDLINKHPTLGDFCSDAATINRYRQLLSQNHHALAQAEGFARTQGMNMADDLRAASLLHNLGEIYTCLLDPEKYRFYCRSTLR